MKKRRKEKDDDEESVLIEGDSGISRKRARKQKKEDTVSKKKRKKSSKIRDKPEIESKTDLSKSVHLDSLQSIFANKDEAEGVFTLFGGDPLTEPSADEVLPSTIAPQIIEGPQQSDREPLYFFPHYESPQKNAQSLFPVSAEPFYHKRTEYEAPSSGSNC